MGVIASKRDREMERRKECDEAEEDGKKESINI